MSWFSRLWTKASATQPLVVAMYHGTAQRGVYTKRNFAQYFDDAYRRNVVAFQAVGRVAKACATIPLQIWQDDKLIEDAKHPLAALLKRPNPWQGGAAWREAWCAYLMLSGNTYIEAVAPGDESSDEMPTELWVLRSDRMRVRPGPKGPIGYTYECNGQLQTWDCDPVTGNGPILHTKFFNPLDDFYGMSPVEAAAYGIDQHNEAGKWNQSLLQNSARPSGALVYNNESGAVLTDKQFDRLKEQINAAYAGESNAGRAMLLEGGLKWQQFSMSPAEMDWINGKNVSAREICLAFGVPPQLLGIPGDSTYSNYQEARQAFYEDTVLPLNDFMLCDFNNWVRDKFDGAEVRADTSKLPALAPKRQQIWQSVQNAQWMTTDEKREATGLPPLGTPEAKIVLVPSGMVQLKDITNPPDMNETVPSKKPGDTEDEDDTRPGKKMFDWMKELA